LTAVLTYKLRKTTLAGANKTVPIILVPERLKSVALGDGRKATTFACDPRDLLGVFMLTSFLTVAIFGRVKTFHHVHRNSQ
jgi:hypothetical protein